MLANFHTHCNFCDAVGDPREYVEVALKKSFVSLGFSCHAPVPIENSWTMKAERLTDYFQTIAALKHEYQGRLEIYTGLEIDYFQGDERSVFTAYPLDYNIGGVHFFVDPQKQREYSIDGTPREFEETLNQLFNGDIQGMVGHYYQALMQMVAQHHPTILAHLDVIEKNNTGNKYFSGTDSWYRSLVLNLLEVVADKGTFVEANTGAISRGYRTEPYPSQWILRECRRREIPVLITSDAHRPEWLDASYDLAVAQLREAGYKQQMMLRENQWVAVNL